MRIVGKLIDLLNFDPRRVAVPFLFYARPKAAERPFYPAGSVRHTTCSKLNQQFAIRRNSGHVECGMWIPGSKLLIQFESGMTHTITNN